MAESQAADAQNFASSAPISPLALAHLTATLVSAEIIPAKPESGGDPSDDVANASPRRLIVAAAEFLELCEEVQTVRQMAKKASTAEQEFSTQYSIWLKKYRDKKSKISEAHIPIQEVLKFVGADRSKLGTAELKKINEEKPWDELPQDRQKQAMYLYLSHPENQLGITKYDAESGTKNTVRSPYSTPDMSQAREITNRMKELENEARAKLQKKLDVVTTPLDANKKLMAARLKEAENGIPASMLRIEMIDALKEVFAHLMRSKKVMGGKARQKLVRRGDGTLIVQPRAKSGRFGGIE